jgi:hypothetical protein
MAWYWIVLLAVVSVHAVNTVMGIIAETSKGDERNVMPFMCLTVWFPLWILTYPVRAVIRYNNSSGFYTKRGISKMAYLFGKRPKRED